MAEWRIVEGFNERYEVSDRGEVYSVMLGIEMKTFITNSGYECVKLSKNGQSRSRTVHSLVAEAFCDGYFEGAEVDHLNNNKLDNKASNLQWVTRLDNVRKTIVNGSHNVTSAQESAKKKNLKAVVMMTMDGDFIRTFESAKEAGAYVGVQSGVIGRVCNGKRKHAAGYRWEFVSG